MRHLIREKTLSNTYQLNEYGRGLVVLSNSGSMTHAQKLHVRLWELEGRGVASSRDLGPNTRRKSGLSSVTYWNKGGCSAVSTRGTSNKLSPFTAGFPPPLRRHGLPMSCPEEGKKVIHNP